MFRSFAWIVFTIATCLIGLWATKETLKNKSFGNSKDPKQIVIDEVAGFSIAVALCDGSWQSLTVAFILFRFFDITKFWPVNLAERLKDEKGIMADDIVAGLYSFAILCLLESFQIL